MTNLTNVQTILGLLYVLSSAIANEECSLDDPAARAALLAQLGIVECLLEAM